MIKQLRWSDIVDFLINAEQQVVLIMPAIHDEWAEVIQSNPNVSNPDIRICIDNSEDAIRKGYGKVDSIDMLKDLGADVRECEGLRLCYISADERAYCFFLESRFLTGDPEGYNAIRLDAAMSESITRQFFPSPVEPLFENEEAPVLSVPLQEEKLQEVKASLKKIPADEPEMKRKINVYSTLFKVVELHFEGGNLERKQVSIPPDALPFQNDELKSRLKTKADLFTKDTVGKWTELDELKEKVAALRKEFLRTCSIRSGKSIMKAERKAEYERRVITLQEEAKALVAKMQDRVQTAINQAKKAFRDELLSFFKSNRQLWPANLGEENVNQMIDEKIYETLKKINFPDAGKLISKIRFTSEIYDFTSEDVRDAKLENWLVEQGLVNKDDKDKLAKFEEAYRVKK